MLTITVNALNGTIDAGPHTATASIVSGPGSFVGSPTCTYTGGAATASCTVTITSAAVGTTVVSATSNIPVNGQTITRTTGTAVEHRRRRQRQRDQELGRRHGADGRPQRGSQRDHVGERR